MAQSLAFDAEADRPGRDAAGRGGRPDAAWSARRKLLCAAGLSAAAWLVLLAPLAFIG